MIADSPVCFSEAKSSFRADFLLPQAVKKREKKRNKVRRAYSFVALKQGQAFAAKSRCERIEAFGYLALRTLSRRSKADF